VTTAESGNKAPNTGCITLGRPQAARSTGAVFRPAGPNRTSLRLREKPWVRRPERSGKVRKVYQRIHWAL